MNKQMTKILSLLLAALLIIACLAGCGEKNEPEPAPEASLTAEEIYDMFLHDSYAAAFDCRAEGYEKDGSYTIRTLVQAGVDKIKAEIDGDAFIDRVFYSDIDCGLDGEHEMALQIGYLINRGEYMDNYTEYFILKAKDQELHLVSESTEYYRTYTNINNAGMVFEGGSNSASSYGVRTSFVNAEGEEIFLYGIEYTSMLAEPKVPYYMVPLGLQKEGYEEDPIGFETNGYELMAYNFTDAEEIDFSNDEQYDRYLRNYIFYFVDNEGREASPSEEYAALYEQKGVNVQSQTYMNAFMTEYLKQMGVKEEALTAEPVDWTELIDADWMPKG